MNICPVFLGTVPEIGHTSWTNFIFDFVRFFIFLVLFCHPDNILQNQTFLDLVSEFRNEEMVTVLHMEQKRVKTSKI